MTNKDPSERIKVRRFPEMGSYDRAKIYPIVDAALMCHVGFAVDDQPYIIPMVFSRDGDALYLHGPIKGRIMKHLEGGAKTCVTITHLDGLVLAKSQFNHSMNYRSVVMFGTCTAITDEEEKAVSLKKLVKHLAEGQENYAREGSKQELKATTLVKFEIEEASAKVGEGAPEDDKKDLDLDIWSGVIPLYQEAGDIIPDPMDNPAKEIPQHILNLYKKLKT